MIHLFGEDKVRAVTYYRHSAEDKQENSVAIQREQVERFAEKEGLEIIDSFQDEGFSGLTADRPGFQALFDKWVTNPNAQKIDYILVYDASRFGRFQNMAEVWRLLGLCSESGIKFATVTRGLPRDEASVLESFITTLDFSMAGEFSKLLSEKVFYGCIKVSEQGYSAGGCPPYGYIRILLDEDKKRKRILKPGERKEISNQRVKFEPARTGEAKIVKRIFFEFVNKGLFPEDIAHRLNKENIPTAMQKTWKASMVIRILTNETYTGTRVYNKTWGRLKEKTRRNPRDKWILCPNAHTALIDMDTFQKAQERLYWLRPGMRRHNSRQIKVINGYIWKYVEESICNLTLDQKFYVRQNLPVVLGTRYITNNDSYSCFFIPTRLKKHDNILLCEIDFDDSAGSLNAIYAMPTRDIGIDSYVILDDKSQLKEVPIESLKNEIEDLANQILSWYTPWLLVNS